MLEIIALIFLTKRIGNIVQAKGLSPARYKALLVALWFVGEIAGFVAFGALESSMRTNETGFFVVFGLLGAALGTITAFAIAIAATPILDEDDMTELGALVG